MSRKLWKRREGEKGGGLKEKNPLLTLPEYDLDPLVLPSLMVDMKTFVWGPAAKQRGNNWRGPGAIGVSARVPAACRRGEHKSKQIKRQRLNTTVVVIFRLLFHTQLMG